MARHCGQGTFCSLLRDPLEDFLSHSEKHPLLLRLKKKKKMKKNPFIYE
jgi:hypothetical protein